MGTVRTYTIEICYVNQHNFQFRQKIFNYFTLYLKTFFLLPSQLILQQRKLFPKIMHYISAGNPENFQFI